MSATTMTAVRERPILFSGPMVRAILAGRKTQTRRVAMHTVCGVRLGRLAFDPAPDVSECPYGAPGDRLWVREATCIAPPDFAEATLNNVLDDHGRWRVVQYVATHPDTSYARDYGVKVTPSIHMPRWASRLTLDITGVRVERVQDISEADARAEGVEREAWPEDATDEDGQLAAECGYFPPRSHTAAFARLWDSLNAARGYGSNVNPWVWVVEFRRVEAS